MNFHKNNQPESYRVLFTIFLLLILFMLAACGVDEQTTDTPAVESTAPEATSEGNTEPAPAATPEPEESNSSESASDGGASGALSEMEPIDRNGIYDAPPELTIDPTKYYYATIKTSKGDIKFQLFADRAPVTVNNFVFLAREGFYDNTSFHRVIEGFMAQAGDPTGTGSGGPGYDFQDEFVHGLDFDRKGLLAMANRGPATNGSQFFITFGPTDWLNGLHTIFGEMIEGEEVLDSITIREPGGADPDTILTIEIEESDISKLPTPPPPPPTATPTTTPTPYAPTSLESADRPLADIPADERSDLFNMAPEMIIDPAEKYSAIILTSQGEITLDLFAAEAPIAVNNFVVLANLGFFDGIPINQVIPQQFVILGSPNNTPESDVGYQFDAETGIEITLDKGAIAYIPMQGDPDGPPISSGSQMLIALVPPPTEAIADLSFFGQVSEGIEALEALTTDDIIESITIEMVE